MFDSLVLPFESNEHANLLAGIDLYDALIPKKIIQKKILLPKKNVQEDSNNENSISMKEDKLEIEVPLVSAVIDIMKEKCTNEEQIVDEESRDNLNGKLSTSGTKRRLSQITSFTDMIPKSLTAVFPLEYVKNQ